MNISITLDTEQQSALAGLVANYNENRDTPVTETEYLQAVLMGTINDQVRRNFETAANALVAAAKAAPYDKRMALIALVQSELAE